MKKPHNIFEYDGWPRTIASVIFYVALIFFGIKYEESVSAFFYFAIPVVIAYSLSLECRLKDGEWIQKPWYLNWGKFFAIWFVLFCLFGHIQNWRHAGRIY